MNNREDNSIHIGNNNKIKSSHIGNKSALSIETKVQKDPWYSKLFWKLFIPIAVVVIAAAICLWLGLK